MGSCGYNDRPYNGSSVLAVNMGLRTGFDWIRYAHQDYQQGAKDTSTFAGYQRQYSKHKEPKYIRH